MKVSAARTEFEKRKKDISDIDAIPGTFLQFCNYVNRQIYNELANVNPEQYISSQTYSLVTGTASYTLPTDFQDISPMDTGFYLVDNSGNPTDQRLAITGFGSSKIGVYLTATSAVFTPTPTSSKTYVLQYIPLLAELTTEDSTLLIPLRFSMYFMDLLDAMYDVWDEDSGAEIFNEGRVVRSLNVLISHINPVGQVIGLPDFSGSF